MARIKANSARPDRAQQHARSYSRTPTLEFEIAEPGDKSPRSGLGPPDSAITDLVAYLGGEGAFGPCPSRLAATKIPRRSAAGHPATPFPSEKQGSQRRSGAPWVIDHLNVVGPAPKPLAAEHDVALFRRFEIMRFWHVDRGIPFDQMISNFDGNWLHQND
jgi:hypothetical protein